MSAPRHLRPRGDGVEQPVAAVELFFDLVFVFAITGLSSVVLEELDARGLWHAGFLLLVVWWGWVNTTWWANWLSPDSTAVRLGLVCGALVALVLAAAIPEAFDAHGLLFAGAYVVLQSGRNVTGVLLTPREHRLRGVFLRLLFWSALAGSLWLLGGAIDPAARPLVWALALAVDLAAPLLGYPTPGLGVSRTDEYEIEGGHFAERCQAFVLIALGESIVVAGATASDRGLTTSSLLALALAFAATGALWWLYFNDVAERSRRDLVASADAGRLARDAFTYIHVAIVAGIILQAVGVDLLLAHPSEAVSTAGAFAVIGGPAIFLLGDTLFRLRMTSTVSARRVVCIAGLVLAGVLVAGVSAAVLSVVVTALLLALALHEQLVP